MHWFAETRDDYCPRWFRAMAQAFPDRWETMEGLGPSAVLYKRGVWRKKQVEPLERELKEKARA